MIRKVGAMSDASAVGIHVAEPVDGVAVVTIHGRDKVNSLDESDHAELAYLWPRLAADDAIRVILVTGAGNVFCAGGNIAMEHRAAGNYGAVTRLLHEARDLVHNILSCDKPIVSAINGPAAGAGLATALLADVSIIGDDVVITDGHTRIGIAAGDHAAIIWPLLCGMARSKYYLLTSDRFDGRTAAEIGLVSKCVPREQVLIEAHAVAARLAAGPQLAIRWTKRSLNHWMRAAGPAFEASLALEMLNFFGTDFQEGLDAFAGKREPKFFHPA
jgi:enoyl-CoA hydratase